MDLTFNQAAKGVNKEFTVNVTDTCERCDGKGNEPGTKVQHCHYCGGSGMVSLMRPASPRLLPLPPACASPPLLLWRLRPGEPGAPCLPRAPASAACLCFPTSTTAVALAR